YGHIKGQSVRFVSGHNNARGAAHHNWRGGRKKHGVGYIDRYIAPGHYLLEHRVLAVQARGGRPLPPRAEVHHINANRADNWGRNLVVCQDRAYHFLLERRTRALRACGHANWHKCRGCKQWDDPRNLYLEPNSPKAIHHSCNAEYQRQRRAKQRRMKAETE
ncbi:hypothetical protein LCGC14_2635220, partial [marine sediment metagenome]